MALAKNYDEFVTKIINILYLFQQVVGKNPSLMSEFVGYFGKKTTEQNGEDTV